MSQGALRQVLTLLGGAGLAQAIALAASPLLTRLYAPEHFGVFALFASLVALIATVATGRYELAVILPASDGEAWQVVKLALLIAVPVTALTLLAVALGGQALAERAGDARLAVWAWLLPIAVLLTAGINTLTVWANRRQAYGALAVNRVAQSGATAAASVGLGAAGWASPGLMLGSVVGQVGAAWQRRPARLLGRSVTLPLPSSNLPGSTATLANPVGFVNAQHKIWRARGRPEKTSARRLPPTGSSSPIFPNRRVLKRRSTT